jgi:phage terminase small subunit
MADQLTAKQRAFVLEYPQDFNGTKAAIRAGYSERGANVAAIRALSNATILEAIEKEYKKRAMSLDQTLARIVHIASGEDPEAKIRDREWGLDLLMRNHGALVQRMEHSGTIEHKHNLTDTEVVNEFISIVAEAETAEVTRTGNGTEVSVDTKGKK